MMLINHRIPHVPLDFYECRFQLKMEGNHSLFSQGANAARSNIITRASRGSDGPPGKKTNRNKVKTHTIDKWAPRAAHRTKGKVSGPTRRSADQPMGPTTFSLRRGTLSLDGEVGSRSTLLEFRPRRGWLPSINMRGGALFHGMEKLVKSYSIKM